MELPRLSLEDMARILRLSRELDQAAIQEGNTDSPANIKKITINLGTAKLETDPLPLLFPFKSVFVRGASDTLTNIYLRPNRRDQDQSEIQLFKNDSFSFERPIAQAYLYWGAQTGKSIELLFSVDGEFRSGSQISQTGGGVSLNDGSAFDHSIVTLSAATAAVIATANTSRKVATIYNDTGADIWFGKSTVSDSGATKGIPLAAGATMEWRNTAALYGYSVGGGNLIVFEET